MTTKIVTEAPPHFPSDSAHISIISPDWDFKEMGIGGLDKVWACVHLHVCVYTTCCIYMYMYMYIHVLMRDEKEERKKQARSNKQTRQSNTAHSRQSLFLKYMFVCNIKYSCIWSHVHASFFHLSFKNMYIHVTLLASFFLPSHLSFKNMYNIQCTICCSLTLHIMLQC